MGVRAAVSINLLSVVDRKVLSVERCGVVYGSHRRLCLDA